MDKALRIPQESLVPWAAGLFEGEGCIAFQKPGMRDRDYAVHLALAMTDRDVVYRFAEIVGAGHVIEAKRTAPSWKPHWKTKWTWQSGSRKDCESILRLLLPFMGERRSSRATKALALLEELDQERDRVCFCGKPFRALKAHKYFCSPKCRRQWRWQRESLGLEA